MENTRPVTTPLFICDAFAADRFKGNQAAVVMVPTSVYLMDWSSVSSLEASFGRGEPEDSEKTEEEREEEAQAYADDRHLKLGRAFQGIATEMKLSETAFIYRLPARRVHKIQEEIRQKAEEFESEYEQKVKEDEVNQLMGNEDANAVANAAAAGGNNAAHDGAHKKDETPGLIPSTSFSMGDFGASFLDVRAMSLTGGSVNAQRKNRPRRLHTQWFGLRWFTPELEVRLCGHATVAAAHAIFETSRLVHYQSSRHLVDNVPVEFFIPAQTDVLCFVTASGIITVKRQGDNETAYALNRDSTTAVESYEVHFPSTEAKSIDDIVPEGFKQQLLDALHLPYTAAEAAGDIAVSTKNSYYVLELKEPRYVTACKPDEAKLRAVFTSEAFQEAKRKHGLQLPMPHALAVSSDNANRQLSSGEAGKADIVSRFFAPWMGILEDPVTGSLYTTILGYWLRRRQDGHYKVGDRLQFYQASARGGSMQGIIIGKKAERVALIGSAVTFLRGVCTYNVED